MSARRYEQNAVRTGRYLIRKHMPPAEFRAVRDLIEQKVKGLLVELQD